VNIVTEFLTFIKQVVQSAIGGNISAITHAISPVFFAAIGLYVCWIAYQIIYAQRDVIMNEVTKTIMSFAVVGVFTYSGNYYMTYVVPFVMEAGGELSSAITGAGDTANTVDAISEGLFISLEQYWRLATENLGWDDFGGWAAAAAIYLIGLGGGLALIYYTGVFLCLSTLMVGILLSVGVIFISFAVFPSTRSMFTAWCGHCLNYILLNVMYTISFGFLMAMLQRFTVIDPVKVSIVDVISMVAVIAIALALIEQVGTLCSSLTGGVGLNGMAAASGTAGFLARASGMKALAGGMKKGLGGWAGNKAQKAIQSAKSQFGQGKGQIRGG